MAIGSVRVDGAGQHASAASQSEAEVGGSTAGKMKTAAEKATYVPPEANARASVEKEAAGEMRGLGRVRHDNCDAVPVEQVPGQQGPDELEAGGGGDEEEVGGDDKHEDEGHLARAPSSVFLEGPGVPPC